MFERLQKPFLTVETGEAYQPIRLTYRLFDKERLIAVLNNLKCCEKNATGNSWNWFWKEECNELHFESLDTYKKNNDHPLRISTLTIRGDYFYINLPSFKRACLAAQFFHPLISSDIAKLENADFINKVFGIDERLPHGFTELFKEEELQRIVDLRESDYEEVQKRCEEAESADEAFAILAKYTKTESSKKLPYAERYHFQEDNSTNDPDVLFLGFYIFLRGRELVAIRRWFGNTNYSLNDAAEETMSQVFGNMNIDIIE